MSLNNKIIFISGSHEIFGGGQVYLEELNKELKSKGIETYIMSSDSIFNDSILIPRIDTWKYKFSNINELIKKLEKIDPEKKACIVLNDITLSMFSIIFKMHGWSVYSLIHMSMLNTSSASKFIKIFYPLVRAFFIRIGSKKILNVNQENEFLLGPKVEYIGNFTVNEWKNINFNTKDINFLYVGRFDVEKQPQKFVELMSKLHNRGLVFRAVMIGDGPLRSDINRLIENKKLSNIIELTGFLDRKDILDYYEKSKFLIITSKTEGLPTVILDAATRNVNFISPPIGSIPFLNKYYDVGNIMHIDEMDTFLARYLEESKSSTSNGENEKMKLFALQHHISHFSTIFLSKLN